MTLSHGTSLRRVPRDKNSSAGEKFFGSLGTNGTDRDRRDELTAIARTIELGGTLSVSDRLAAAAALRQALAPSKFLDRDRLVVDCLQRFYGGRRSLRDASEEMAAALRRYHATPWLRDRCATERPGRIAGGAQGAFWLILKTVDRPLSADRIRRIVGQFEVPHAMRDEFNI
ncbi:hypothetical protein [Bradyrhizobium elkanii]|uniref:hypothetical protein n=1 Tax=Bradyrhizobium elkanii TaxID=29448 RepID=UPI00209DC3A7|nr:hypothetical protein [Bradyrhizobium elkanii]MCP1969781.1 hypothetical protein [Bradyrhizobium elkanii]MCS4108711.1 hypothetical protein [Bradyrhizobium elkanii]